jgi:hypothetical protein
MGFCALGLIWFFKRKGWIGPEAEIDLDEERAHAKGE